MPYGVDTIRLRISFPAAPVSRGYNGRAWKMRPLRGWTGGARWDALEAAKRGGDRDGSAATGPGHAPTPGQGQAVPVSQAVEGGGPASELLAAFRAQRMGALQGQGLAANGAVAPGTAGRDGNGPGSAPSMPFGVLPRLDVTPPGAPITAADPDPYASSDLGAPRCAWGWSRLATHPDWAISRCYIRRTTARDTRGKRRELFQAVLKIGAACRMAPTSSPVPGPVADRCRHS